MTSDDSKRYAQTASLLGSYSASQQSHACNCIGAQPGFPVCPCMMRGVKEVDGRWTRTVDLGPVTKSANVARFSRDLKFPEKPE